MATTRTVQAIGRAGINLTTLAAAADATGDNFANTGSEFLYVNNASAGTITLTLVGQQTVDGQTVTNRTVAIPTVNAMLIGPFPVGIYNDANGRANVTWSGVTSTTIVACKLTPGQ